MESIGEIHDDLAKSLAKIQELTKLLGSVERGEEISLPRGVHSREAYAGKLRDQILDERVRQFEFTFGLLVTPFIAGSFEEVAELPAHVCSALDAASRLVLGRPVTPQDYFGYELIWREEPGPDRSLEDDFAEVAARHGLQLESFRPVPVEPPQFEEELLALLERHNVTRGQLNVSEGRITKNSLRAG